MTLIPGVIRAGQWVDVADPSHGEERGEGCCVSACLSAHPWRATPPPRQPKMGGCAGSAGRAGGCAEGQGAQLNSNIQAELGWGTGRSER